MRIEGSECGKTLYGARVLLVLQLLLLCCHMKLCPPGLCVAALAIVPLGEALEAQSVYQ